MKILNMVVFVLVSILLACGCWAEKPVGELQFAYVVKGMQYRVTWTGPVSGWRLQTASEANTFKEGGAVQKLAAFMQEPLPSEAHPFILDMSGTRPVCRASDGTRLEVELATGALTVFSASGKPVTEVLGVVATKGGCVLSGRLLDAEPVFGLGQRLDRLNKRGQRVTLFTSDGYNNSNSTYMAIPLFTTHRGGGVFVNLYDRMVADFGAAERNVWRLEIDHPTVDVYLFAKDRIDDALAAYTALSGHADEPEGWNMGPIVCRYYPDLTRFEGPFVCDFRGMKLRGHGLRDMMERHIALGAKPRAVIIEGGGFIDLYTHPEKRDELRKMVAYLASKDIKPMVYMRVGDLCSMKAPGYRDEFCVSVSIRTNGVESVADTKGIPDRFSNGINPDMGKAQAHVEADITHPAFWDWYVNVVWKDLVDMGVRGVKIDFCELLPEEGLNPGGVSVHYKWRCPSVFEGVAVHHAYPTFFISKFYREMQRLTKDRGGFMVLSRGGGIGSQRNPFLWAGDQHRLFEKLDDQLLAMLNAGMSGVPFMTYDMAGYQYADFCTEPDGEIDGTPVVVRRSRTTDARTEAAIFRRGTEFTAFSPCVQTHGFVRNAYDFDEATRTHYRDYMKVHAALADYIARCNRRAAARGTPVVRPLAFRNPENPRTWDVYDEFLLGDALLVAPSFGAEDRKDVFLPAGDWTRVPGLSIPVYVDRSSPDAPWLPRELSAAASARKPEVTVVPGFFAGGGRMYCLSNHGVSQMSGTVFVSPQGRVVVVDGGEAADGEALGRLLQSLGGVVSRWFITHNHDDHWGALYGIMTRHPELAPKIEALHYAFPPDDWFRQHEPNCCGPSLNFRGQLQKFKYWPHPLKKGDVFDLGGLTVEVLNDYDLSVTRNACNNSSICLSVKMGGKSILVTGDLGAERSDQLVRDIPAKLPHDVVFLSHHGQYGASRAFYAAVRPRIAIWPTTDWLWDNWAPWQKSRCPGSANFQINYVKCWMQELGVKEQYVCTREWDFR